MPPASGFGPGRRAPPRATPGDPTGVGLSALGVSRFRSAARADRAVPPLRARADGRTVPREGPPPGRSERVRESPEGCPVLRRRGEGNGRAHGGLPAAPRNRTPRVMENADASGARARASCSHRSAPPREGVLRCQTKWREAERGAISLYRKVALDPRCSNNQSESRTQKARLIPAAASLRQRIAPPPGALIRDHPRSVSNSCGALRISSATT